MKIKQLLCESTDAIPLSTAFRALDVSKSGYYAWLQKSNVPTDRQLRDMKLRDALQQIALEYPRYGYRRMTAELQNRGILVNRKKVLRLMKEDNLLCVRKRFKPMTTDSNHFHRVYPNLVRNLQIIRSDQVWASDITYVQLVDEFVYLAVVLDLFTRRCIGWQLGRHIDTQLTLNALQKAIRLRWNPGLKELIHHSDQGVQYASNQYVDLLKDHGFRISMSRKGNPYDNAFVESFIKTLKYEEVYLNEYETFSDALNHIGQFIDIVYNKKRLHSSLGYRSPEIFEKEVNINRLT
jgi:transposase InsO family protein